jgi:hypothetical protein
MPFVRRDADGKVEAAFMNSEQGANQELPQGHPELLELVGIDAQTILAGDKWLPANLAFARVTEDLIEVLIGKGVIAFTDLPVNAQEKLISRQGLRSELSYVESLFGSDEDNFL